MSFYSTPLKHGKGVNKPFRSPLIKADQNDATPKKINLIKNTGIKSLGLKSPLTSRGFNSPMKPLLLNSPSKPMETETHAKCSEKRKEYSSPLKRIENNILPKQGKTKQMKLSHDHSSLHSSELKLGEKQLENNEPVKLKETSCTIQTENSPAEVFSKKEVPIIEEELVTKNSEEKLPHKEELSTKTPPATPGVPQIAKSPEFQPVVILERINPDISSVNKKDFALLIQRIKDKKREMVELRAKVPLNRKHNLEEIKVSIMAWREAFEDALESLRNCLTEKNGRSFSTSEVLKLLSIPNNIVHFSEEENVFTFSKVELCRN